MRRKKGGWKGGTGEGKEGGEEEEMGEVWGEGSLWLCEDFLRGPLKKKQACQGPQGKGPLSISHMPWTQKGRGISPGQGLWLIFVSQEPSTHATF